MSQNVVLYVDTLSSVPLLPCITRQRKGKLKKINGPFHTRKDFIYFEIPVLSFQVFLSY